MADRVMLAADIGAGSGRVFSGRFDGSVLAIREEHRFIHTPVCIGKDIYRNFLTIWDKTRYGLHKATKQFDQIASIGIDSFAPDFCVIDRRRNLASNMLSYQSMFGCDCLNKLYTEVSPKALFRKAGTQPDEILMLPQLLYYVETGKAWLLQQGQTLPLASALNFFLTGEASFDFSSATITMLWDRERGRIDESMLTHFIGISNIFPPIAENMAVIGNVRADSELSALKDIPVINVGAHDTADAMFLLGEIAQGEICVNCGTWAVVGVIVEKQIVNDAAFSAGLTNYGLPNGRFMLGCVFPAMMYLQDCVNHWRMAGEEVTFGELSRQAAQVDCAPIDLDAPIWKETTLDTLEKINCCFDNAKEERPKTKAEITRCIYESVAIKLGGIIRGIEKATGKRYSKLYLGGGSIQSECFCARCTAHTGKETVRTCPEATIAANLVAQLLSSGALSNGEIPKIVFQ